MDRNSSDHTTTPAPETDSNQGTIILLSVVIGSIVAVYCCLLCRYCMCKRDKGELQRQQEAGPVCSEVVHDNPTAIQHYGVYGGHINGGIGETEPEHVLRVKNQPSISYVPASSPFNTEQTPSLDTVSSQIGYYYPAPPSHEPESMPSYYGLEPPPSYESMMFVNRSIVNTNQTQDRTLKPGKNQYI